MTLDALRAAIPDFAKDIRLNLASVLSPEASAGLNAAQIAVVALAAGYATAQHELIAALESHFEASAGEQGRSAAKSAAAIMAMNNVYYRFTHLVSDKDYQTMPARLRMQVIANPGVPKVDFELACLGVSAMNGCGSCIEAHARQATGAGLGKEAVQSSVRIAAVVNAAALALRLAAAPAGAAAAAV